MNANTKTQRASLMCILPLALAVAAVSPMQAAQNSYKEKNDKSDYSKDEHAGRNRTDEIRVRRASALLGQDIRDSQGQKVGDIVDFALDLQDPPRLRYVLAMTGGFLDMNGDVRAIPADAISVARDDATIRISRDDFNELEVLPDDRIAYLNAPDHQKKIDSDFKKADRDYKSSMNSKKGERQDLVLFSEFNREPAQTSDGSDFGRIVDVWVNLDDMVAPYAEVRPKAYLSGSPFTAGVANHYAIPTSLLKEQQKGGAYGFDITEDQLRNAKSVSAKEGVSMIESGPAGDTVLVVKEAPGMADARSRHSYDRSGSPSSPRGKMLTQIPDRLEATHADLSDSTVKHFVGQEVSSKEGKKLGKVDDFIIDANSGKVTCAVVSSGGVLGIGDDLRVVPTHALKRSGDNFSVEVAQAEWNQTPKLNEEAYEEGNPSLSSADRDTLNRIYGESQAVKVKSDSTSPTLVRASRLRGMDVSSGTDGKLGEIESVVIDPSSGNAAAVLDPEHDVLSSDDKILVPIDQLQWTMNEKDSISTDIRKTDLQHAADQTMAKLRTGG